MTDWKKYKLGEIVDYVNGGAWPAAAYTTECNGIPVIRVTDIKDFTVDLTDCKFLKPELKLQYIKHQVRTGDLIVSTVGSHPSQQSSVVGKTAVIPVKADRAFLNQNAVLLKAKDRLVNKKWLGMFSRSITFKEHVERNARGSANQVRLAISSLLDMEVLLPPLEEQEKVASILSSLDDKIELNRRMNQTLEQIAATLFKKYFVDDIDLDNLPEGWRISKVSDCFNITIGRTPPRKESQWFTTDINDVKWISIKDMGNSGTYISQTSEYLTREAVKKFNVPKIPPHTVVLSFKLTVGRVAITTEEMLSNEAIAHFIPKADTFLSSYFTYLYLKDFDYDSLGNTSSIATAVNSQTIKDMKLLVPSRETVDTYSNAVASLFQLIENNQKEIQTLSKIRDTFLPKLMSSEIDLSTINQNSQLHAEVLS